MSNDTTTAIPTPVEQAEHQSPPSVGLDPGYLQPPADPSGYSIEYRDEHGEPIELNAEQAQMDSSVKQWAFDAGLPGGLVAALADIAQMPGEIQTPEACEAALQRTWPGGEYHERLERAARFIGEIEAKRPGLVAFLENSRLGNSPTFITMVEQHARTRAANKRGNGK